jgi:uncharacterized protein (TIGR00255 family)
MAQPLQSMTGYARAAGSAAGAAFTCEIKSVNGRGLDLRLRLPAGFDALDPEIRRRVGKALSRGSITLSLTVEREGTGGDVVVNRQALQTVLNAVRQLAAEMDARSPSIEQILQIKGVVEQRETRLGEAEEEALQAAILAAADVAIADLVRARQAEGRQVAAVLVQRIDEIEGLAGQAEAHPSRSREEILARLRVQLAELTESGLPEERLAQEALLLATKADIREELDRLKAHIKAARALIAEGGPAGRKLDFLSQEFNREANTLCSKSNAVELTAIGLDLKAVIDQFREQVQNVE